MEGESSQPSNRGGDNSGSGPSVSSIRVRSRPDCFLIFYRCFRLITSLAAILCIAVNVLSAVRSFKNGSDVILNSFAMSQYNLLCNLGKSKFSLFFLLIVVDIRWNIPLLRGGDCNVCGGGGD